MRSGASAAAATRGSRSRPASTLARRIGARELVARGTDELAATGAHPQRPPEEGGYTGLTPRELQVARKAAEGLSNPEIAQALFVTRKTVEAHMRSIFRKLGISGREEIGARLDGPDPTG